MYYDISCKIEFICESCSPSPPVSPKKKKKYTETVIVIPSTARVDLTCLAMLDLSASTQYTLIYKGQRYNSVTAEYV